MLAIGDRIDVWVVTQRLGMGGMGSVYRCHNVDAPRIEAAIKVLGDGNQVNEEGRRRFIREAEILYRVRHPNVVAVRNVRMDVDPPFLEMEYVEGRGLHEVVADGPHPVETVLGWVLQVATALAHLHGMGIRHRDIKPANLILGSSGQITLVDFGLALETDGDRFTREGMTFGTVSYAPPEWMDPATLDPVQWDLYALGVVFYELLTGTYAYPLSGEGPMRKQLLQVALAKQKGPALDPGEGTSHGVRAIVRRLTAPEVEDRFPTAADVVDAIEALSIEAPAHLRPLPPLTTSEASMPRPVEPSSGLWRKAAVLAVAGATTGAILFAAWMRPDGPPPRPAPPLPEVEVQVPVALAAPPEGLTLWVQLPEAEPVQIGEDGLVLDVAPGSHEVTWWLGGCDLVACPGEACPAECAARTVEVTVDAMPPADGPQVLDLDLPKVTTARVRVDVPSMEKAGGLFKRRPTLQAWLGGRPASSVAESSATFQGVRPGRYPLVVAIGSCTASDAGCTARGTCPKDCASSSRTVTVPFDEELVSVRSPLTPPD